MLGDYANSIDYTIPRTTRELQLTEIATDKGYHYTISRTTMALQLKTG